METHERMTVYQAVTQNIRDLKANQWRFSNYGLLVQAALAAMHTRLENVAPCWPEFLLSSLSLVTVVGVLLLIHEAQDRIFRWRCFSEVLWEPISETLKDTFQKMVSSAQQQSFWSSRPWKADVPFAAVFSSVQCVGCALANLVFWLANST